MNRRMESGHQLMIWFPIAILFYTGHCSANTPNYRHGDFVPIARRGQYHSMRTPWHDQTARHCPRFGINSEEILPIPKPVGYTGSDPYKVSLQIGKENFGTPWLFVVGRKGSVVPMIDVSLKHTAGHIVGVGTKVVSMPDSYLEEHEDVRTGFLDPETWPKHVLVRYTWEEKDELDVSGGLLVLFASGFAITVFLALHILQSSKDRLARFINETLIEEPLPGGEAKVD